MSRKVIFTAPDLPTFVQQDIELLNENYEVVEDIFPWNKKWLYPYFLIIQLFRLLVHIPNSLALFCSFGGYWCLLPTLLGKIFGKPVYIILNGTDCCAADEINYGVLRKPIAKWACRLSYASATRLLPISQSLMHSNDAYAATQVGQQGVKFHFPTNNTPFEVIPYGIDVDFWNYPSNGEQRTRFISVSQGLQFARRDGQTLLELFERNSEWRLTLVGSVPAGTTVPANVEVIPWMSTSKLRNAFSTSSFYIQLSLYEGFGCALAEAMACGCIPIGTAVNEVPQIIGDSGIVFRKRDVALMEIVISNMLAKGVENKARLKARNQIVSNYSLGRRRQSLFNLIETND